MTPIVYISGPITGMPELNRPAFASAAAGLRAAGFTAVDPFEVCQAPASWEDAMRADVKALMDCTAVATLPGWTGSRGARLEVHVARELGMQVQDLHVWLAGRDSLEASE